MAARKTSITRKTKETEIVFGIKLKKKADTKKNEPF
jgi:imidazoleglycerol phosphate dehydratase HisB